MFTQIPWTGPSPRSSAEPTTGPARMPSDRAVELSLIALGRSLIPTKSSSSSCSGGAHSAPAAAPAPPPPAPPPPPPRHTVQDQQDAGVPDRQGVRQEQNPPGQRHG